MESTAWPQELLREDADQSLDFGVWPGGGAVQ